MRQACHGIKPGAAEECENKQSFEKIRDMIEDFDILVFGRFIQSLKDKDAPPEKIAKWEAALQEYIFVGRQLFDELGGQYSVRALKERIPENLCVLMFEKIAQRKAIVRTGG